MDIATIIGLLLSFSMMYASIVMGGGRLSSFWDTASVLMVFGGTAGAILMAFPLKTLLKAPKAMLKIVLNKADNPKDTIALIVSLAETARKDGLLALESRIEEIKNPFVKLGIQMAVDGTRPEVIEDVLRTDMESMALRHKEGKSVVDQVGRFGPAFGMIGTLMGLIIMLGNMSDPSKIGAGMAVALITTLYGAVLSNAMFLPFAEKLAFVSKQEIIGREIAIRGIMALQSGENPRLIEQKLRTWLAPKLRTPEKEAA
jgi:chemotaxis protein MotA